MSEAVLKRKIYSSTSSISISNYNRKCNVKPFEKSAPDKYFSLPTSILLVTGMYPIRDDRNWILQFLYTSYTWFVYSFFVILNPITKVIALPTLTNLDDLTDTISFLVNHFMAIFKIAVFMVKKKDLLRLVEMIEGKQFRHKDCGVHFSANNLITEAVRTTRIAYFIFCSFVIGLIFNSMLSPIMGESEEITNYNITESPSTIRRALPFHSWYPFSTEKSPMYELIFAYQIFALFSTSQIVMAMDTIVVGFMIHIKVQFQILSHNLRFIENHAENKRKEFASSTAQVSRSISNQTEDNLDEIIEKDLERHVKHHQAIIQLSEDFESVFTYQLLLQFVCSLFAFCTLLWQVSSTPVLSAKFASMLSYLGATAFQLFMYCWFGNEMMLESLSVAEAAWNSGWHEIISRRYSYGVAMIMHRSQKVIMITAGGFAGLTLETFMTVSRAAYSCFAVLKKINF